MLLPDNLQMFIPEYLYILFAQMKLLAVERDQLRGLNTEKQDIINRLQSDQGLWSGISIKCNIY